MFLKRDYWGEFFEVVVWLLAVVFVISFYVLIIICFNISTNELWKENNWFIVFMLGFWPLFNGCFWFFIWGKYH